MPETKEDYMLLAVHTDKEFTRWLQQHAEDGWWLEENKGNTFVFTKKPYAGKRICSFTVTSPILGVSAEDAFYDYLDDLRKNGWNLLTMGAEESFTDRTRHAFLYEMPREDLPHPEIPQSAPEGQRSLLQAAFKKALSTFGLCLIYAAFLIFLLISRPALILSNLLGKIYLGATAAVILPCIYFSLRAIALYRKAVRDPKTDSSAGDYHSLDKAVRLSTIMLTILVIYLVLDLLL